MKNKQLDCVKKIMKIDALSVPNSELEILSLDHVCEIQTHFYFAHMEF
jgi:hypothetical protein